jgi:hypothetical protein
MKYTKADLVLALAESIHEQSDMALLYRIKRETGVDFLDEEVYPEEVLQALTEISSSPMDTNKLLHFAGSHPQVHAALAHATGALSAIGTHVGNALGSVAQHAAAHPAIAGAAALGLGAAAALRARSNMKARAQNNMMNR